MSDDSYLEHIRQIESGLSEAAFKSQNVSEFTDETDALKSFEDEWKDSEGRARLSGRTPLMLERDRILYSDEFRGQSDRHHILFLSNARVRRDYASHILRMAQVSRAICGRLGLNSDLAEAIALGAKVGGVPFIHVGKRAVDKWVKTRVKEIDKGRALTGSPPRGGQSPILDADGNELPLPTWVDDIEDRDLRGEVKRFMPWAAGATDSAAYSSGQQSYWSLSLRPFQLVPRRPYVPQTMYGIWNHSLTAARDTARFNHKLDLGDGKKLSLDDSHLTHEAVVVRYADDITWVIENLNEASKASSLAGFPNQTFNLLARDLHSMDMPPSLHTALTPTPDIGKIYTYFINDLASESTSQVAVQGSEKPVETQPAIVLSDVAQRMLRGMKKFLIESIFSDDRINYRNRTLEAIIGTVLDVFWETKGQALNVYLDERSKLEGWSTEDRNSAIGLLDDAVHRVQASVDALAFMSDREVYSILGLESQ